MILKVLLGIVSLTIFVSTLIGYASPLSARAWIHTGSSAEDVEYAPIDCSSLAETAAGRLDDGAAGDAADYLADNSAILATCSTVRQAQTAWITIPVLPGAVAGVAAILLPRRRRAA